jgi:predicted RNA-binding Zn ribbon-like protein
MFDIQAHEGTAPSAPGELELLQRFVNLHRHASPEDRRSLPPTREMVRDFLVSRGLIDQKERFTDADREKAMRLADALRHLVDANAGAALSQGDAEVIDRAGLAAGLHPHFHAIGDPTLEPRGEGLASALGRLVAIAFVASFDGTWEHLKRCANDACGAVFFDRSKNHSGRWCSMQSCGNRAKVRAWRERQRLTG